MPRGGTARHPEHTLCWHFLFELILQLLLELAGEAVVRAVKRPPEDVQGQAPPRGKPHPAFVFCGCVFVGTPVGAASLAVLPHALSARVEARVAILLLSPLCCGGVMHAIGTYRERRGVRSTPFANFLAGFGFALGITSIRFWFLWG